MSRRNSSVVSIIRIRLAFSGCAVSSSIWARTPQARGGPAQRSGVAGSRRRLRDASPPPARAASSLLPTKAPIACQPSGGPRRLFTAEAGRERQGRLQARRRSLFQGPRAGPSYVQTCQSAALSESVRARSRDPSRSSGPSCGLSGEGNVVVPNEATTAPTENQVPTRGQADGRRESTLQGAGSLRPTRRAAGSRGSFRARASGHGLFPQGSDGTPLEQPASPNRPCLRRSRAADSPANRTREGMSVPPMGPVRPGMAGFAASGHVTTPPPPGPLCSPGPVRPRRHRAIRGAQRQGTPPCPARLALQGRSVRLSVALRRVALDSGPCDSAPSREIISLPAHTPAGGGPLLDEPADGVGLDHGQVHLPPRVSKQRAFRQSSSRQSRNSNRMAPGTGALPKRRLGCARTRQAAPLFGPMRSRVSARARGWAPCGQRGRGCCRCRRGSSWAAPATAPTRCTTRPEAATRQPSARASQRKPPRGSQRRGSQRLGSQRACTPNPGGPHAAAHKGALTARCQTLLRASGARRETTSHRPDSASAGSGGRHLREAHGPQHLGPEHARVADLDPLVEPCPHHRPQDAGDGRHTRAAAT